MPEHLGVLIGAAIVLVYTVSGGFRAVCWTDLLQALLMLAALVVFPIYILVQHGGYAVLAAICSTADSQLVVAASAAANDIYARLLAKDKTSNHVLLNRTVVFAIGFGAALLVIDQKVTVFEYVLTYGWAILGAAFGPQVILILLWRRASYAGCLAGMLTGFVVPLAWKLGYDPGEMGVEVYNLPLGFGCAMIVNVVVSWLTPDRRRVALASTCG